MSNSNIVIVGGGAAGFFAAIRAAEVAREQKIRCNVIILESSESLLKKVRISGGGRCNVTHHIFEVRNFVKNYPRGSQELISAMQRFQAQDTVEWFAARGVTIVPEEDGRMFPDTDSSETIIGCFLEEAKRLGVEILQNHGVQKVARLPGGEIEISFKEKPSILAAAVMVATGSSAGGYVLAESLGHTITERAPSLFSFKIEDRLIKDLPGLSFPRAEVQLLIEGEKTFKEAGPLLITHWGLSGPAVLKISAWAAREMLRADYKAKLQVNWLGFKSREMLLAELKKVKDTNVKSLVGGFGPLEMPKRFWFEILRKAGARDDMRWADLSNRHLNEIVETLFCSVFSVEGKNRYKDEFVECGGVALKEIDFKTMESKIAPGIFFAGEILDIDGITGGFNFQNAWTGGWIAGQAMVAKVTPRN